MLRYQKYNYLAQNLQLSKAKIFNLSNLVSVQKLAIEAGHFKPTSTYVEHGLLLTNICGQIPQTKLYKHGKRLRNTVIIQSIMQTK
jgi:hypothetical protein